MRATPDVRGHALAAPDVPDAAARAVQLLRARGELWESVAGAVGLRGDALALFRSLERALARLSAGDGEWRAEEWMMPAALSLETLERARYFESFPQWLTVASHLSDDAAALERVARSERPALEVHAAVARADAALPPAVCYHAYAALAGRTLRAPALVTAQGGCWRHEGDRLRPLARGWAFTMREAVCLGDERVVRRFADHAAGRAMAFATSLGLRPRLVEAEDPFFAPTARGRALLQRVKALKHELLLPLGDGEHVAAASVNRHERFFGERFDIRLDDDTPASGACVAFGVERWMLAVLAAHGPNARDWPSVDDLLPENDR